MSSINQETEQSEIRRIEKDLFRRRARLHSLRELSDLPHCARDLESWRALISEIGARSSGGNPVDDVLAERR